jgi:hypothetical protein
MAGGLAIAVGHAGVLLNGMRDIGIEREGLGGILLGT